MATPTKLFSLCSLLMASLFAWSSSVQFDDPDWYFWFPLYASACGVNLINGIGALSLKPISKIAKLALWLGVFLFIKVAVEDFVYGIAGFWSLDLKEKVVREKFGSGFVVNSMYLQLQAASVQKDYVKRKEKKVPRYVECGMAILVVASYGMSYGFFVLQKGEMKS
ncbi:uncharacterized protein LOC117912147 isoform X1 [Vitis riparia]|uniref:uncharacterized protein LOC117912147 isoform X1 n=1 Tax=Vitis riparia TaxID=96939 RepID=UPI00155A8C4C|nr:uncharacterized protein LOC117912147 isoform X1 [Vitis riparia]